ncbi:MAG: hypothetical protein QNJ81_02225 [Acidimicrobiia bacterium]|nr:hypothetical protein [Acidimicrobiia bacterium]
MAEEETGKVTFQLTGPRKGYTGMLGGRYYFKDGKIEVPSSAKDHVKRVLCTRYACNVVGEAPIWETDENGGAVKVGEVKLEKAEETTVSAPPTTSVEGPAPKKAEAKKG